MNAKKIYKLINALSMEIAREAPIEMPGQGTDHDKVQYLLDEYARRLKKMRWRYILYRDNRKIPELVCRYLGKILTEDERKKTNKGIFHRKH